MKQNLKEHLQIVIKDNDNSSANEKSLNAEKQSEDILVSSEYLYYNIFDEINANNFQTLTLKKKANQSIDKNKTQKVLLPSNSTGEKPIKKVSLSDNFTKAILSKIKYIKANNWNLLYINVRKQLAVASPMEWLALSLFGIGIVVFSYGVISFGINKKESPAVVENSQQNYTPPIFSPAIASVAKNTEQNINSMFSKTVYTNIWSKFVQEFQEKNHKIFSAQEIHPRLKTFQLAIGSEMYLLLTNNENQIEEIQLRINTIEANKPFRTYQEIVADLQDVIGISDQEFLRKISLPTNPYQIPLPYTAEYQNNFISAQITIEDPLYIIFRIKPVSLKFDNLAQASNTAHQ